MSTTIWLPYSAFTASRAVIGSAAAGTGPFDGDTNPDAISHTRTGREAPSACSRIRRIARSSSAVVTIIRVNLARSSSPSSSTNGWIVSLTVASPRSVPDSSP